jgi:hypothetical protein
MRVAWVALISSLVLAAAGCGGDNLGAGQGSAAEQLKPGALVYWETETDPDSDQWQQAEELLKRFPDGERWIAALRREVESEGDVTWEGDIKPALGAQTAVAVYGTSASDVSFVGLTNPDNPDKTVALVEKLNESNADESDAIARVVDDWVVIAEESADIDAALKAESGDALSDHDGFESAMEELPDDSLSRVYVDAAAALELFGNLDPETRSGLQMFGLDGLDFAGAWAKAEEKGAELALTLRGEGADRLLGTGNPYTSQLLDRVPADAWAFYTFRGDAARQQFQRFQDNPLYSMGLREVEQELGVQLSEIVALFEGEVAFYSRPGAPIPELTLLLDAENPEQARGSAERLLRALAERAGGEVTEDGGVTTAVFDEFSVNLGTTDGAVVLSTSKDPFTSGVPDESLGDTDRYQDSLSAAGAPDEYTGLAYVDLAEAVELFLGYAAVSDEEVPPEVSRNLEPLRSLVAYGEEDGNLASQLVFVEIGE